MENNFDNLSQKQKQQLIGYSKDLKTETKTKTEIEKITFDKPFKHSKYHYTNALNE